MIDKNNRIVNASIFLLMAFLFVVFVADDSEAATYKVDSLGGSDYTNITQAVENASAGDTINIASRNYFDAVDVDKRLTITGGNYGVSLNNLYSYCYENDLIGYYQFDNSGTYVSDRVWCENNYGYLSGAVRTPGFTGDYSVDFDGDDDYLAIDHDSVYNVSKVSVSAWVNLDDNDTEQRVIFSNYQTGSTSHGYEILINDNARFEFFVGFGSSDASCTSDTEIVENKWTLVTATYDQSSIKLYINDELEKTCSNANSISNSDGKQIFGASDYNSDGTYNDFFDGTIDEVLIWEKAISSTDVENIYWGGEKKPRINASEGSYAVRLTVDSSVVRYVEVAFTGPDIGESSGDAGLVIEGTDENPITGITITDVISKYDRNGLRVSNAKDIFINSFSSQGCDTGNGLKTGVTLYNVTSSEMMNGNVQCAETAGYLFTSGSNNNIFNTIQAYSCKVGFKVISNGNYFNNTYLGNNDDVGILFYGSDNNQINDGNYYSNKYAIGFTRGAENNRIKNLNFDDNDDYDIHHGYDSNSTRNGWNNILIDTEFEDLSIDSNSRLLEKTLIETTITDNGTYAWNRVNETLDSDRRAYSGTNSFWAGNSDEDEYDSNWNVTFKMSSDISLPSGGLDESRILEIRTWYKTEEKYDGGRVYITKDQESTWNLLTPLGGYDSLMNDGSDCDNNEKAFTGDKSSSNWQNKKFNLSGYRGEDVRIKFVFCSDGGEEMEGWYIDNVKIYKDVDSTNVAYFDDFERLGHRWVDARGWVHEGNPVYGGKKDADIIIIEDTSSETLLNKSINKDMRIHLKLDESGTSSAYDSVAGQYWYRYGNSNYVSGLYGNAIEFDGSGDYLQSSYDYISTSPYRFDELTVSSWVNFDSFPSSSTDYDTVVGMDREAQFRLQVNSSGNPVAYGYFYSPSGEKRAIGDDALVTGVWYHLAATWSETTDDIKLYVNGTLVKTYSFSETTPYLRTYSSYMYIGRDYNGHYMDGKVDNVQIWQEDFSARNIKAIYEHPINGPVLYSTKHYGGSDSKTDNDGKLEDIYVTTKIYDGSSSGSVVDTYIGIRYGDWTREIAKATITDSKLEAKVFDFRVYNRNKDNLYYSLSSAVSGASSGNTLELWPGKYKENIEVTTKIAILGAGTTRTIIDARYRGPALKFTNYQTDYSSVKNLRVTHSSNQSSSCQSSAQYGGAIYSYYSDFLTIDNVHFFETYIGFMSCYTNDNTIKNSVFDRGSISSYHSGIYIYGGYNYDIKNNVITKYSYGIYLYYNNYGSHVFNNSIHNNTNYGIYMYQSGYSSYASDPLIFEKNSLVDNSYGFYRGDSSSSHGRYIQFKDNLVKSNSNYGIYCYYYCQDWKVENNTFDGDDDQNYGWYTYRYQYRTEFGNNTFRDHTSKDIYLVYCGTGTNANKFFYNTYSTITVSSGCQVDIYNNLNVKTVEEDSDAFSNVEIEIKDSSKTYYETSQWGGSDSLTDSNGFISSSMLIRSGYYASSSTLTDNNITVNLAYGVRAKSTWINFDTDTTKAVTVPDAFRLGVVKNTNTSTIYTSFSSAVSAASTNNVLNIWAWTYNENFVINKGITIIGNSTASSIINGGTGDYAIEVKSHGVTIKNLTLNGASDSLLYAGNYNNLEVENIVMSSSSSNYGIYFDRTSDTTITSVTVNDTDRKSVYIDDGDTITFKNSHFMNSSSSHGFEISDSEDIILDNVFIYNAGYDGSSAYGLYISGSDKVTIKGTTKVGSSKSYELYATSVTNLKIQNTTFSGKNLALIEDSDSFLVENSVFKDTSSGDNGVYIKNTDNGIFKFNTITNSASDGTSDFGSIYLTSSSSNQILNNTVTNSGRSGIHLKSSSNDNKIYGNTVSSSHLHGLYIQSSDNTQVRNNSFSSSSIYGIKSSSSDDVIIDNNTLDSNSNYGIYLSSSDTGIIKANTISDNQGGIYITGSDDVIISSNSIDDHSLYGAYLADSKRVKIKKNVIKNSQSDALVLSSNCDNAYIDNNTIKNNGLTTSGRAVKLYEVDHSVLYNNSIESNEYTGVSIIASNSNKIIQNIIKGNGKYGVSISNDFTKSANNTIKSNTINDNEEHGIYNLGIYTKIISNTIKYNEKDGINIQSAGARTSIEQNTITDNEDNAISVLANYITIKLNTIDGSTSDSAVNGLNSKSISITNNTIEGGLQGVKISNGTNSFIYNNTITSNSETGIYLLGGSHSSEIKSNTVKDNEDVGIHVLSSNLVVVKNNIIEDNNGYGIYGFNSKLLEFQINTIKNNDGGVKFSNCDYCNLTSLTISDNGGRGIWFLSGSDNNYIKHVSSSSNSIKDVYLQDSNHNTAFNFTFSTISLNTNATLTITSNLEIVFQDGSGDPFEGIDFALLTAGVKVYSTPFYGGSDAVSDSNGEAGATFSLNYRIYNGSSTPDTISNIIKYHYGVRSKEKSIDMSTSHTETVSVPSYWVKGLVRNTDSSTDYYKIQDAIDNASSGDTLHIWAWKYSENVEVDESITIIGNGTGNTTLNATSSGKGFDITSDDVTIRNINVEGCGSTDSYNGFQLSGDDITIENVIVKTCYRGAAIGGSGAWVGNSTFSNNSNNGIEVFIGDTSTTAVKIYKNTLWWNGNHGIGSLEDDVVISTNNIRNNTENGIYLSGAEDAVISDNTIVDNKDNINIYSGSARTQIKNNLVSSATSYGMRIDGTSSNNIVIEGNTIKNNGVDGIYIKHSDYFYLGNNTISGSGTFDLRFSATTIGNSAKNTTFSTISVHSNAYFAIYNDLTLKFMQNATVGFDELDVKLVSDSSTKYATSYYGGSDSKTNTNGLISSNFTLKFRIYDGTSTPDEATTTLYYHYGVRAKAYNLNMTTSHTETVSVPSYWKDGLVENLDSGLKSATIQDAIDNASSGDTLKLWSWNYVESDIEINERVTIIGNSSGTVSISANWENSVFNIQTNTITLKNLTLKRSSNSTDEACIKTTVGTGILIDNVLMNNCGIGILVKTSNVVISNVTIEDSVTDGIVVKNTASNVRIENSTIKRSGDDGIQLESNVHLYNNTISSNTNRGIYVISGSDYAKIRYNTIDDNDEQGVYVFGVHHVEIRNNVIEDNENYGIQLKDANYTQIRDNTVDDNDGGLRTESTYNCNITGSTFKNNNGKGIWFTTTSNGNNIRDTVATGSSSNDIELDDSKKNTGFNFTFGSGSIDVDSNSDFRVMNTLNIKFTNGSEAFAGVDLELFNYDTIVYATPFYSGNDAVSSATGFISGELTVAYEIYNGSSTTEDVDTTLKYHYGVRGKSIDVDTGTSHTETVDVPSYWTKGLVRNTDTSTDYYKIQHAIDNASAGDTLHVWAWTYHEALEIDESINLIGNASSTTKIIAGSGQYNSDLNSVIEITSDDVTLRNLTIIQNATNFTYGIKSENNDITISNNVIDYLTSGAGEVALYVVGDNFIISNNSIYEAEWCIELTDSDGHLVENNILGRDSSVSDPSKCMFRLVNSDGNVIKNNTFTDSRYGITLSDSSNNVVSDNTIIKDLNFDKRGIRLDGSSTNNQIINNTVSGYENGLECRSDSNYFSGNIFDDNQYGILFRQGSEYNKFVNNTIKNSEYYGILLQNASKFNEFWNNTISSSDAYDFYLEENSTGNFIVNTQFTSISVDSSSDLLVREYFILDVNDASGSNMSGIDIKVMENDVQKYATDYFGGSDSKTDSSGTITTFLINSKKYDGSSTPTTIPTYVTARNHDWVETFTSDPSSTVEITVPDLRVQNIRTGTLTYHIQTSIDAAEEGDTVRAWNGTYYENIDITEELILKGNGTTTIINGNSGNAIEVSEDSVTITDIQVVSSENGIYLNGIDELRVYNVKFVNNEHGLYVEDSTNLVLNNSIFDVDDYGVYSTGTSGSIVRDNSFRNGTDAGNYCIYQSESDSNGNTQIIGNTFNDCYTAWKSSSNANTFRDNTLKDNQYGVLLAGTASHDNLIKDNTFDDSDTAIYIYNTAHDNIIFENDFDDSDDYDIKLSDSYDTVSYNNTFSSISVASDSNMWIKVYLDLTVYDNASNAFSNVDVEVKQDNLIVYSSTYFSGDDPRTNMTGQISTFLVATSQYNGSSTPTAVTTTITARYSDWISSSAYNINNAVSINVADFRVQNQDSEIMYYSIGGAINAANTGDTLSIWKGTYYENIIITKEITLVGNGTSQTIINGSLSGTVVTVDADEVVIDNLAIISSGSDGFGLLVSEGDGEYKNLKLSYNNVSYSSIGDFNELSSSVITNSNFGIIINGDNNVVTQNTFSDNQYSIHFAYTSEDSRADNNEITDGTHVGISLHGTEEITIRDNYIHNNSGYGIRLTGSAEENIIFNNDLDYNSLSSIYIYESGNNSIHNNTFKSNDDGPVFIENSYNNIVQDNAFNANDDYLTIDGGGQNSILFNTFAESGILLQNANNQIITGNTITDASDNGVRIYKSSSNNYLSDNSITGSDDDDIYVGGSGSQVNNRGFNNSFSFIKVQGNGEFVVLDYIGLRTINSEGNMSGNDVKATFGSDTLYASDYFSGSNPVTDSNGLIPNFIAPIEIYDGSSTPDKVITPMTVRYSDWIQTFNLDPYSGSSITVFVPELRVKNNNTGEWTYLIQTSIDNAGVNDVIVISPSTYYETITINKIGLTVQGPSSVKLNDGVIIDAENNGCAITVTKSGISVLGLNVVNSFAWEDPFNSSGIRVLSDNNIIRNNSISDSYVGILLETADNNEIHSNEIDDVDIGILLTKSDSNSISSNDVLSVVTNDIEIGSLGYTDGSNYNEISLNTDIQNIEFQVSDSNFLYGQEVTTITLENSERISMYESTYSYVMCDSDSSLYLKNWMNINVVNNNTDAGNADVKVLDGDNIIYSTSYFGGSDSKTSEGKLSSDIEVIYRVFDGSSTGTDNTTIFKIRVVDWFNSKTSDTDEIRVDIDFEVPLFRITNLDTGDKYNYIQTAIDNATDDDIIHLDPGEYSENIIINKDGIALRGYSASDTIIKAEESGSDSPPFSSPPIFDEDIPAIVIIADNVVVEYLTISGFDTAVMINGSRGTFIHNLVISDILSIGIHNLDSIDTIITDLHIHQYTISSIGSKGTFADSGSDNFELSDSFISGYETGIHIASSGASIENVSSSYNDNYGVLVSGTNIEILDSTFIGNGINGIYFNGVISATLTDNTISDNGNAEIRIVSSFNIEIDSNSISDPSDGYGIHSTSSDNLNIHDNNLNLSIWLSDSDFNTITSNIFSEINGGSITYDNAAIIIDGSNNTISDNVIDDVGIAFAFLSGSSNYNLVENNTLGSTGYDIEYYTSGTNNTFINTEIGIVDIDPDSYFELINFIDIEMLTVNGPAQDVELEILQGTSSIYSTERYFGSDDTTDSLGGLDRLFIVSEIYDGAWVPEYIDTFVTYYYDGAEYTYEIDTSTSHSEKIWVNLRPISDIDEINGIGDNTQTGVEEAVKGADQNLLDDYTVAYWSFDEGSDAVVLDSKGGYSGTILPIGIWNSGRPNSTADTSVEFDGTFTNIDTDLTMNDVEFTVEVWFRTNSFQKMTLVSDKDNLAEWGYNLYVDDTVSFSFTVDGGESVELESQTSVRDNEWHFVSIIRGQDYVGMWLDGVYTEIPWSGEIDFTNSEISIGQTPLGGDPFNGLIDDLRFSSIARHEEDLMTGSGIVEFKSASYDLDGDLSEYVWESSLDGVIGDGSILYYPVEDLSEGSHTIYLKVEDNNGTISDVDSSILVVMQRPDSQILSLKINDVSAPWGWGVQLNNGDLVSFSGGTTSSQFISSYSWTSSIDGILYEGGQDGTSSFSTTLLSNGTHTISFSLRGGNGLWSTEETFELEVNGRPEISENVDISDDEISRFRSAMLKVKIIDDETLGVDLDYTVSYRVKGTDEWFEDYIDDISFNNDTKELEFSFTPDGDAPVGDYEFSIDVVDELGGVSDNYVMPQSIAVENNQPIIGDSNLDVKDGEEPKTITEGEIFDLGIESSDEDGIVSTVVWYADIDGDGSLEEIGTGSNFTFEDNNLPVGDNLITVRVLDNEGSYTEQSFTVVVVPQVIEESLVAGVIEDFSNNLPLIASLGLGVLMVVGTIALRRNRSAEPVEGLVVDDGADPALAVREPMEVEDWDIPTDAQGNALIIGEYMAKRRESYITHPNNEEVVDYLHNNRERFAISSYFDVPGDPTVVVTDWALPENLRGNVHLDSFRQQIVERITNSAPDKNFVIIGEPGVGKTVMLFEVFDRLMNKAPVGILSTDTIAKAHEMFGVRVFYDDIPENQKLVEALTENDIKGVIVSSREADWKALPTEMQAKFDRLTVPLFSELDMKAMIQKMMSFQSLGFNDDSVEILAEYAEGSPIYVWSMVREMMHRSVKTLTREYIEENSVKGMINYVAQLLQRLLKDGEEYRKGGLHALASLIFLSDHMEERYCNDYFFDAYVEVLSKHTEEKLDDKMNPKTLNLVLAYLPINDSVIRFPHDTWPDVLQGWGDMNPFSTELRMINRAFADSGIFQDLKKEVVTEVWNSTYERYKRTPSRQKNSFLALADTLFQNFTIDELKDAGVDIDIVRQVASTYSHIPQAAKLISKIQAVLPQTVTRIINMQDIGSEGSHAPYKIQEMYLIYNDGRMLSSLMDEEAKVDSDIMSSMLTAINDFVKDSFQTTGNLGSIDYGENQIILERGKHTILASVVYGEANRDLRSRMSRALTKIEDEFSSKLKSWDGDVDSLSETVNHLQPIMDISKPVTKDMIDELQALKSVNLRSSWTQTAGFFQVNLLLNNYSKKQIKGAKLTLEYGADFLKLVRTEPTFKYKVGEVDIKKIPANAEMSVTLYFEPLKSAQSSLNVHLDYDSKGGNASGVSTAVFERVDLYKDGVTLNIDDIDNAVKAEVVASPQTKAAEAEVVEAVAEVEAIVEDVEVAAEIVEVEAVSSDVEVLDADVEEADSFDSGEAEVVEAEVVAEVVEEPEEPAMDPGDSGVDDILSKLNELDDPENAPKKKEKKSEEDEDKSGMDDLLGKLDEL